MWMVDNQTPFEADRTWVRNKDGRHEWIVVVKATYDIGAGGALSFSDEPVPPLHAPEFHGQPGQSSIRYEASLIPMRPATDVYLNAIAYAPAGKPQEKVAVSFRIGGLRKSLAVYGARIWRSAARGVAPSSPASFTSMPIRYERAYGGCDLSDPDPRKQLIDLSNPVGTGIAIDNRTLVGRPAPNIEAADGAGTGSPPGFGAIASFWSPRKDLAGTYDGKWAALRKPLLPEDYDPRSLLCAPADQQAAGYLRGGEPVELVNLTPEGSTRFALPQVSMTFETHIGLTRTEHSAEL